LKTAFEIDFLILPFPYRLCHLCSRSIGRLCQCSRSIKVPRFAEIFGQNFNFLLTCGLFRLRI